MQVDEATFTQGILVLLMMFNGLTGIVAVIARRHAQSSTDKFLINFCQILAALITVGWALLKLTH